MQKPDVQRVTWSKVGRMTEPAFNNFTKIPRYDWFVVGLGILTYFVELIDLATNFNRSLSKNNTEFTIWCNIDNIDHVYNS